MRPVLIALVAAIAVAVLYLRLVVPWEDRWGATAEDLARPLSGDEFVPSPYHQVHHVVVMAAAWRRPTARRPSGSP